MNSRYWEQTTALMSIFRVWAGSNHIVTSLAQLREEGCRLPAHPLPNRNLKNTFFRQSTEYKVFKIWLCSEPRNVTHNVTRRTEFSRRDNMFKISLPSLTKAQSRERSNVGTNRKWLVSFMLRPLYQGVKQATVLMKYGRGVQPAALQVGFASRCYSGISCTHYQNLRKNSGGYLYLDTPETGD